MAAILVGNWWALAIRGVIAILYAVIAFFWPGITVLALVLLFGAYALVDGIFALVAASRLAHVHGRSGPLLLEGVLDIIIALICFVWPATAIVALVYLIAIWAILSGIALIVAGMALLRLTSELMVILGGVLSILLGIILFIHPAAGVVVFSWWIGIYALLFGIAMLAAAFRIRYHPI